MASSNKLLIVMGNGPSLKEVDFSKLVGHHSFGLNAAYRAYERLAFWPTYFGCFDNVVCKSHASNFSKLIQSSPIERFFFLDPKHFPKEVHSSPKFQTINFQHTGSKLASSFEHFTDAGNSGANACQCGILMGYKRILLLGCDCNYVERIEGSQQAENRTTLVMKETPVENPNYWFDDYQQKGDRYHVPQAQTWHQPYWKRLAKLAQKGGIQIINCSAISTLDCFPKGALEDFIESVD